MRETVKSLRAYLLLVGLIAAVTQLFVILVPGTHLFARLWALVGLALGVAYFGVGLRLPSLLTTYPHRIELVLIAGACYSVLLALMAMVAHALTGLALVDTQDADTVGRGIGGLLVTLYLLRNVKRLAAEAPSPSRSAGTA